MEVEPKIVAAYVAPGKVRLIYRHLLQIGEGSLLAAEASECAGDQGKFWEMREAIYRNQDALYVTGDVAAALTYLAQQVGVNVEEYGACMQAETHRFRIESDFRIAQEAGIRSRPVFEVNGQRIIGARPFEDFQRLIEE